MHKFQNIYFEGFGIYLRNLMPQYQINVGLKIYLKIHRC